MAKAQHQPVDSPRVSVVLATHNRAHLLPHAIRSIIHQTFTDWELIVIDDASTDNTPHVVQALMEQDSRLRYHRHTHNRGLAAARNTSTQLARGRYIALQDDDDLSLATRLDKQVRFLESHPDIDIVAAWRQNFDRYNMHPVNLKLQFSSHVDKPAPIHDIAVVPIASTPTLMARAHVFKETPMRLFFSIAEDWDFILRCIECYGIATIEEVLYHYRLADHDHITLSTATSNLLRCWGYHCLAWTSSFHRRMGWHDPVHKAKTIDDACAKLHPQFRTQARPSLKKLAQGFITILIDNPKINRRFRATYPTFVFIKRLAGLRIMLACMGRLLYHRLKAFLPIKSS
ncbi:MAG: glycosyltransferase [Alphaproteobacteria bacterium GM202ARS2]|nr:glycosyltransferase [Alphaproteobacteria bacterium GM202ARS2]